MHDLNPVTGNLVTPLLKFILISLFIYVGTHMKCYAIGSQQTACVGVGSLFYHVGPRSQTQAVKLGGSLLHPLNRLPALTLTCIE